MHSSALYALSPVDGRYAAAAEPLRAFFSEAAFIDERIRAEALWFLELSDLMGANAPGASLAVRERAAGLAVDPGEAAAAAV